MNVAFFSSFNERGTSIANYDYAHFNEVLLNNTSVIFAPPDQHEAPMERFRERFRCLYVKNVEEIDQHIVREKIDVCYMLTHGRRRFSPDPLPSKCRTVIHCVFRSDEPHGNVYACISDTVNERCKTNFPVVPHIVHLPSEASDLREELNIPKGTVVFGRHGGFDRFNINFVPVVSQRLGF